jgi:hypothetical protein
VKHRRPSRDNRGGAACILATYAVAAGALALVYAAVNPLPATQIRDLVSPPAASASVPTRPLSVLPGMGAGLELVRIPRGLDVHTVPWSGRLAGKENEGGAKPARAPEVRGPRLRHTEAGVRQQWGDAHQSRHSEGDEYVGRHRSDRLRDVFVPGWHDRSGVDAPGRSGRHPHGDSEPHSGSREGSHGHPPDGGRHHRNDGNVGGHHQGSHSQGGHHAEHGGGHR